MYLRTFLSQVMQFNEKLQAGAGRISGGFFVCKPEVFNYLSEGNDLVFEQEPLRKLASEGEMVMYEHNGFWQPMDTPRDQKMLTELCSNGQAPWINW
jgi:glucose-1-phosphate cytidylyltransferase